MKQVRMELRVQIYGITTALQKFAEDVLSQVKLFFFLYILTTLTFDGE